MSNQDLKSKVIGSATPTVEPLFDYKKIITIFFYLVFPLAFIVILCNRIYIKQQKKCLQEKENKKRARKNKIKWLFIIIVVLILEIVLVVTIQMWLRWIFMWTLSGLIVLWLFVISYEERFNKRLYKLFLQENKKIEADLAEQKVPKQPNHPYLVFFSNIIGYKTWAKIEDDRFDKLCEKLNIVSWKNGIIVNRGKKVMVPINIWDMHILFIGASGFGKTYNILKLCFDAAYNKFPICILDGKADGDLEKHIGRIADLFNSHFTVWNLNDHHKAKYNPFAQKNRIELIDMISEIFDYSLKKKSAITNIYAGETRAWITLLVDFLLLVPELGGVSLENLAKFTVRSVIIKQLSADGAEEENDSVSAKIDAEGTPARREKKIQYKNNPIGELYRKFNDLNEQNKEQLIILHNDFEELYLNTKNVISSDGVAIKDFMRINRTNQILLFQLYTNITNKAIAKILLYDFQQLANYNEIQRRIDNKITVFIVDEASEVFQNQSQISGMVQQFRSKRIALGFGIQEKAGVEKEDKRGLLNTIINNCTTFFISRLRDEETIRAIAAIHGTRKHLMHTDQTISDARGNIFHSGAGSLRVDETFIWHPNDIRKLLKGQVMFSTMSKKLINNWPEYKTIETDEIHSNLQVDNIMNIIAEFEFKKANLLKSQNDVAKFKSNFDTKLLIKIENMTDVEWNIYRKNKWNDKLQKENKTFKSVPSDFMVDKNAHIKNLYQEWIQTSVN